MNVLQHTRNERNPCLKQNRPDRSYRDTLLIALEPELYIWTLRQTTAQKVFLWCCADLPHLDDIYQRSIPTTARSLSQQVRNLRML